MKHNKLTKEGENVINSLKLDDKQIITGIKIFDK